MKKEQGRKQKNLMHKKLVKRTNHLMHSFVHTQEHHDNKRNGTKTHTQTNSLGHRCLRNAGLISSTAAGRSQLLSAAWNKSNILMRFNQCKVGAHALTNCQRSVRIQCAHHAQTQPPETTSHEQCHPSCCCGPRVRIPRGPCNEHHPSRTDSSPCGSSSNDHSRLLPLLANFTLSQPPLKLFLSTLDGPSA